MATLELPALYVDTVASATGVMIHRILEALSHPVSEEVAICIYTAILSDTGSFRYSNANPEAFRVAGEMVALDLNMVLAGLCLSLISGLIAGLYPAWRICRVAPAMHLKLQ